MSLGVPIVIKSFATSTLFKNFLKMKQIEDKKVEIAVIAPPGKEPILIISLATEGTEIRLKEYARDAGYAYGALAEKDDTMDDDLAERGADEDGIVPFVITMGRNTDEFMLSHYLLEKLTWESVNGTTMVSRQLRKLGVLIGKDKAMMAEARQKSAEYGGIDVSAVPLQIRRDPDGIPLPLPQQNIPDIHLRGLSPVIINVLPAQTILKNFPFLSSFVEQEQHLSRNENNFSLPSSERNVF